MNNFFTKKISFRENLDLWNDPKLEIKEIFKKWAVGSTVGKNIIYRLHRKHTQQKNDLYLLMFEDFDDFTVTITNNPETINEFKHKAAFNENRFN